MKLTRMLSRINIKGGYVMKKLFVLPFLVILLFGCQNEHALLFDRPEEAVIGLEQQEDFAQNIRIIGQHAYHADTYYFVFEGTHENNTQWYIADVKKDKKEGTKWYVNSSINLEADENRKSGTDNYFAHVVPKNESAQDGQFIIETTDSTYNVLVELETNE